MGKMNLQIEHEDGDKTVAIWPTDYVAFEITHGKPIASLQEGAMQPLYWLAWHSEYRNHRTTKDFDGWLSGLRDLEPVAASGPLGDAAPSPG